MTSKHVKLAMGLSAVGAVMSTAVVGCDDVSTRERGDSPADEIVGESRQAVTGDVYKITWEDTNHGWTTRFANDEVHVVDAPAHAPSPSHAQLVNRSAGGGNYYSPKIPVQGGLTYCVGAAIKWVHGYWPFVGVDFLAGDTPLTEKWLIGKDGTPGVSVAHVHDAPTGWVFYTRELAVPLGVDFIKVKNEAWAAMAKDTATTEVYFDDITVSAGGCPADGDHDNVIDDIDDCPNTPLGEPVNALGCSLSQVCPCDGIAEGPWQNHVEYVQCVVQAASELAAQGVVDDYAAAVCEAAHASCPP